MSVLKAVKASCVVLALLAGGAAAAAGLRVTPLRLDLSAAQTSNQIELTNFGSASVPVQVTVRAWTQVDGRDTYAPTKDIFFAPPIVTVPENGKAIVRFRLRGKAPADAERPYRVYFQEMAPPQSSNQGGMSFRLKLGVPLFVAPSKEVLPTLDVVAEPSADSLKLTLANTGAAHLKVHGIELYPSSVNRDRPTGEPVARATHSELGANYLLPGTTHQWSLKPPPKTDLSRHVLLLRTDDFSARGTPGMNDKGWLWKELGATAGR